MRWLWLWAVLLSVPTELPAQLLNVEDLRLRLEEDGWYGIADFNFRLRRNRLGRYTEVGASSKIVRLNGKNRWLAYGSYQLTRFENIDAPDSLRSQVDFSNVGLVHLRYNRLITKLFTWEGFVQGYYDQVQEVRERYLLGAGPRFTMLRSDTLYLNMGLVFMFEYEENTAPGDPFPLLRDLRLSAYASAGYQLSENFGIQTVFYYQPLIDQWSDFRFTNQTELSFRIFKSLNFNFRIYVSYDSRPPNRVPNLMYSLSNGLSLRF